MSTLKTVVAALTITATSTASALSIDEYNNAPEVETQYMQCINLEVSRLPIQFSTEEGVTTVSGLISTTLSLPVVEEAADVYVAKGPLGDTELEVLTDYSKKKAVVDLSGSAMNFSNCSS